MGDTDFLALASSVSTSIKLHYQQKRMAGFRVRTYGELALLSSALLHWQSEYVLISPKQFSTRPILKRKSSNRGRDAPSLEN